MRHAVRPFAALLIVAVAALTLCLREAGAAARCKAVGASCQKNANCCSGLCQGASSGRRHASGVCAVPKAPNGEACSNDVECASAHCVDGACCNTACTGSCFTCDGGTCGPKAAGEQCDDGLFCTAVDTCNGAGSCQGSGSTCPLASQSGECTDCVEATDSCSQSEGNFCGLGAGESCSFAYQCSSGFCVDGVCCESDCSGYCEACSAAKTGYGDGTCAPIAADTDPDAECDDGLCVTGLCDGAGGCGAIAAGEDPLDQCPEGQCVTGLCGGGGVCGVLSDTTPCNDGNACSQADHCDGVGSCVTVGNGCGRNAEGAQCYCDEISDTCSSHEGMTCTP
jgi:hypothetical protein